MTYQEVGRGNTDTEMKEEQEGKGGREKGRERERGQMGLQMCKNQSPQNAPIRKYHKVLFTKPSATKFNTKQKAESSKLSF